MPYVTVSIAKNPPAFWEIIKSNGVKISVTSVYMYLQRDWSFYDNFMPIALFKPRS